MASRVFSRDTDFELLPDDGGKPVGRILHRCPECKELHVLDVDHRKLERWTTLDERPHVQAYWPELSPAEREEFFMSGICGKCWDGMIREGDDDD